MTQDQVSVKDQARNKTVAVTCTYNAPGSSSGQLFKASGLTSEQQPLETQEQKTTSVEVRHVY